MLDLVDDRGVLSWISVDEAIFSGMGDMAQLAGGCSIVMR